MAIKGIVKFVSGLATATDQNGTTRVLQTGDRVYAGEVINTDAAPGTVILVELDNGAKLDLPSGSSIAIDPALFKPEETARPAGQTEQEAEAEVAKLQKALENGEDFDPNQLPPTAAGAGGAGGAGNEGHTFLDVSYLNPAITPDSGFPTTGPAIAFGQIQPFFDFLLTPAIAAAALPPAPPAGAVPVLTLNPVTATEGEEVVFTATVSTPSATPFSITLTNGVVINFAAGATTGSSDPLVLQANNPFIDNSTSTFGISSGTLPGLDLSSTATLTINDSIDTTVVTLNPVTGVENGQVVYTATLNNPPQTPFSITLSNGVVINFAAGATTGSSDPQTLANDVYTNGVSDTLSIVASTGGNFEDVDISDTAPLTVTDSIDTTVVTLNPVTGVENGQVVYTATLNNPPQTPFSITLSNGVVINFAAGATTGSSDPQTLANDVYTNGVSETLSIVASSGGNFEAVDISDTAPLTVTDSIDTTVVTLNPVTGVENGQVVYTATLNNPPQTPFSITLSNGVVINFAAGATTGSSDPQTLANDVYTNGVSDTLSIVASTGGNFEDVDISDTAPLTVTDSIDVTTLTFDSISVAEDQSYVFTARLSNPPQTAFSVTLTNGVVINFAAGSTVGTSAPQPPQGDDPHIDTQILRIGVASTSGGNFESLNTSASALLRFTDTIDTTTVSLTATPSVTEGDNSVTYTATLTNPAQSAVVITLSNGSQITIAQGQSQGTVTVPLPIQDNANLDGTRQLSAEITNATGGNFERLVINPAPAVTEVTDTIDTTTVTLDNISVAENQSVVYTARVDNAPQTPFSVTLTNGAVINFAAGSTVGTSAPQPPQGDDPYRDAQVLRVGIASTSGGNYEQVTSGPSALVRFTDTVTPTTATLSLTGSGNQLRYTLTLSNPTQGPVRFTLSDGRTITVAQGRSEASIPVNPSDPNAPISLTGFSGGNFEQLNLDQTPVIAAQATLTTLGLLTTLAVFDTAAAPAVFSDPADNATAQAVRQATPVAGDPVFDLNSVDPNGILQPPAATPEQAENIADTNAAAPNSVTPADSPTPTAADPGLPAPDDAGNPPAQTDSTASSQAEEEQTSGSDSQSGSGSVGSTPATGIENVIEGDSGNDTLQGTAANDSLNGAGGNDILVGGEGNDILIGGPGQDLLTGGAGRDTFVFTRDDLTAGADTISADDFKIGNNGDVLDVRDVLVGLGISQPTAGDLGTIFNVNQTGGNTTVSVNINTASGTPQSVELVTLQGVTTDLNTLLNNQQIEYTA